VVNLASNLVDTTSAHAERVAVRVGETATTYTQLDQASAQVAGLLREHGTSASASATSACRRMAGSRLSSTIIGA
jgi:non-ribosomal peptide synthetase component E (peptide arylation enzyme)